MQEESEALDPREELRELTSSVRAWVEWHADCGAELLPIESTAEAVLASLERRPGPSRGRARPAPTAQRAAPSPAPAPAQPAEPARAPFAPPAPRPAPPPPPAADRAPAPLAAAPMSDGPVLGREERIGRLAVLADTVKNCTRCGLHAGRKQTVFSRGDPGAELCFVGEGPGADEDAQGEPFVGKAGQLLDKMIAAMGLRRDEIYIANCVKCRPPNNRTPEPVELASCMPYLHEQLEVVRPRVIVALGATALRGLLGTSEGITKVRGTWRLYRGAIPVMPTFHPSYVMRMETKEVKAMVWSDLQLVLKELGRTLPARG